MSGDRPTGTADLVKFEIDPSSGVIFLKNTPVDRVVHPYEGIRVLLRKCLDSIFYNMYSGFQAAVATLKII